MSRPPDMQPGRFDATRRGRGYRGSVILLVVAILLAGGAIAQAYVTSIPKHYSAQGALTAAYRIRYSLMPVDSGDRGRLRRLHLASSDISTPECIACHGSMVESKVAFHRIHLENRVLPGMRCNDCHRRVDLEPDPVTGAVNWVDVGLCKQCHSAFPGLSPGSKMRPEDFEADCAECHSGRQAYRHKSHFLANRVIATADCRGCHGGRVLGWDPLHEKPDWLAVHGTEALKNGQKSCFSCHDFGLKFCDTCHSDTPPSHTPAEQWKAAHPAAAKADTRACHTCHDVDSCKGCHLSHERGWKAKHPTVVHTKGARSCQRCHSASFCSYCHMDFSSESALGDLSE